jgi:hypothetical protein
MITHADLVASIEADELLARGWTRAELAELYHTKETHDETAEDDPAEPGREGDAAAA